MPRYHNIYDKWFTVLTFASKPISFFEQESTPMSDHSLQGWRGRLRSQLDTHASYQRDSLVRAVSQICHDLETRCHTIEGPLRCERERASALEAELSEAQACVSSLEQKRMDDDLFLSTLRTEKTRLETEKEALEAQLGDLQTQFENSRLQGELALREQRDIHANKEMQLESTIDHLEKTLKSHTQELRTSREDLIALTAQYDELQIRFNKEQAVAEKERQMSVQLGNLCESLKIRLEKGEHELSDSRQSVIHKEAELVRLAKLSGNLENELQQSRTEQKSMAGKLEDLQTRHHELAQSSTRALQEVEAQYEVELEQITSESAEEFQRMKVSPPTQGSASIFDQMVECVVLPTMWAI